MTALAKKDMYSYFRQLDDVTFEALPESAREHLLKKFAEKKFVEELASEHAKYRFNADDAIDAWLSRFSKTTKESYTYGIQMFRDWLDSQDIHPLDVTLQIAQQYCKFLQLRYPKQRKSQELRLTACSSFYNELVSGRIIVYNPIKNVKLPPSQKNTTFCIPNETELEHILIYLRALVEKKIQLGKGQYKKTAQATWLLPVIRFMIRTGVRVGFMEDMTIDAIQRIASSFSKTRVVRKELLPEDLEMIKHLPFKKDTIRKSFYLVCQDLWKVKVLKHIYSVHDLRHAFAVREYKEDYDIERVRVALSHADIRTTQGYLRDLHVLKEKN